MREGNGGSEKSSRSQKNDATNAVLPPRWLRNETTKIRCPTAPSLPSSKSVLDKKHGATEKDSQSSTKKASTEKATYPCVGIPASYPLY
jgi:hypothetical protein